MALLAHCLVHFYLSMAAMDRLKILLYYHVTRWWRSSMPIKWWRHPTEWIIDVSWLSSANVWKAPRQEKAKRKR